MSEQFFNGTIEVTGAGEVEVAPDQALISLTVITSAATAAEAAASNAERMQAVVAAITKLPHQDISSFGLGVSPITSYDPETESSRITGFRATNGITVVAAPADAGRVYDAGVQAGSNQSSGISFRVADERPHRAEALRVAVERAHADARTVAESAAIDLLGPECIQIDPGPGPIVYRAAAIDTEIPVSPMLPNDITIAASVRIVFRTRA